MKGIKFLGRTRNKGQNHPGQSFLFLISNRHFTTYHGTNQCVRDLWFPEVNSRTETVNRHQWYLPNILEKFGVKQVGMFPTLMMENPRNTLNTTPLCTHWSYFTLKGRTEMTRKLKIGELVREDQGLTFVIIRGVTT